MDTKNELEVIQPKSVTFTDMAPGAVLEKASIIANALTPVVEKRRLFKEIGGKKHVYVEGWTTMLAMLGIFPIEEWSKKLEREGECAYESRVVLRNVDGVTVGAGEAVCSSKERNWANRDEYAIKSMSQTRAVGKAARLSFSWIMNLAGFAGTPAEEVEDSATFEQHASYVKLITEPQRKRLYAIWKKAGKTDEEVKLYLNNQYGFESTKDITMDVYESICAWAGTINETGE